MRAPSRPGAEHEDTASGAAALLLAAEAAEPVASGLERGYWARVWRRFRRDRTAMAGAAIALALVLLAIFAQRLAPFDPAYQDPEGTTLLGTPLAPTTGHWLGTDTDGRDALSRVIYGAQISLLVGVVANGAAGLLGLLAGSLAGYFRGWVDTLISRFIDVFLAFPIYLLALALVAVLNPASAR